MESPGRGLPDEVEKIDPGVICDVAGQAKHKMLAISIISFPPQNADNKRIRNLWIDMIRVCDISKRRP